MDVKYSNELSSETCEIRTGKMKNDRYINDHPAEKRPMNSHSEVIVDKDVIVTTKSKRSYVTIKRRYVIVAGVVTVLVVLAVGLLSGLLTSEYWRRASGQTKTDNVSQSLASSPAATIDPSLPWGRIRLPKSLIPSEYWLHLRVDLSTFIFVGDVNITINAHARTDYIVLHSLGLRVNHTTVSVLDVTLGSHVPLRIVRQFDVISHQFYVVGVEPPLAPGRRYMLYIGEYWGLITDDLRGLYRSSYLDNNGRIRYLLASQLQAIEARRVFPGFDEPEMKAVFHISISHQKGYRALSNMASIRNTTLPDGWIRTDFGVTPIMSTYILAFVVSDFVYREGVNKYNLKVRVWAQPAMYEQTKYALNISLRCYEYFTDYFGIHEIVPKQDQVAVPDFGAGAMENWGLVIYRQTSLLFDPVTSSLSSQYFVTLVIAHEVAHTWFGNMATMKWWDDLWLNEGFASSLMYFAMNDIYPEWSVFDIQLVDSIFIVMTKDSLTTSHPISTHIEDPDDITSSFDTISYDKGLAVLRLLRGFLGEANFRTGLQTYVTRYKFKNAEMSELWRAFSEVSHMEHDVGVVMETWTRQMGLPVVNVGLTSNGQIALDQERFLLNSDEKYDPNESPFGYKWYIPFTYQTQDSSEVKTTWLEMQSAVMPGIGPDNWLIGNYDYMGFYRTNYDLILWNRLVTQLRSDPKKFTQANRAGLISDAFELARATRLRYDVALNISMFLSLEEDFVPWKTFIQSIYFIEGMLSRTDSYGLLKKYIRQLVEPAYGRLSGTLMVDGTLPQRNLRILLLDSACRVGVPKAVDFAIKTFNDWMYNGIPVPSDYAFMIYATGIRHGGEKEWNFLWNQSISTRFPSERETMMNALGHTREPWLIWRYLSWTFDREKLRLQDLRGLFAYVQSSSLGRTIAYQFMLTRWTELCEKFSDDNFVLRSIISYSTQKLNTDYELKQLQDLYRDHPPDGKAQNEAENSLALVKSNIKWMTSNYPTIAEWLRTHVNNT